MNWRASVEPAALNGPVSAPVAMSSPVGLAELMASQAISLKRIADALDSESPKGSVLYWLEQVASAANAGRS